MDGTDGTDVVYSIHLYAQLGEIEGVMRNISSVNTLDDRSGWTPLMRASFYGRTEVVKVLLANGADVNMQSKIHKCTAIFLACRNGYIEIVKLLLDKWANPNIPDIEGRPSMYIASYYDFNEITDILVDYQLMSSELMVIFTGIVVDEMMT
jgi:ankyrin repeat protein